MSTPFYPLAVGLTAAALTGCRSEPELSNKAGVEVRRLEGRGGPVATYADTEDSR